MYPLVINLRIGVSCGNFLDGMLYAVNNMPMKHRLCFPTHEQKKG